MSKADRVLELNIVDDTIVTKTGGSAAFVLDIRGNTGFVPWFSAGTHSYQWCDEDGDTLPGSTSTALVAATKVEILSSFVKITVDGTQDLKITQV